MKEKRWFKSAICLAIGIVTLTAAVFANYDNANGYSVCKNAAKEFLKVNNYSMQYKLTLALDGTVLESIEQEYKINGGGNPKSYSFNKATEFDGSSYERTEIRQDGKMISMNKHRNGETDNMVQHDYYPKDDDGALIREFGDSGEKIINFLEALCDTFVGDLKNNFYLTESQDGSHTYAIDLKGNQMPEVVTAGVSLVVQNIKDSMRSFENMESDVQRMDALLWNSMFSSSEPYIDTVSGVMTVNADGLPTMVKGAAILFGVGADGKGHELTLTVEGEAKDYGTTEIAKVDLNTIPDLLYVNRGITSVRIDTNASQEEKNAAIEHAHELAEDGFSVRVIDEKGEVLQVISKPLEEVTEEIVAE